MSTLAKFGIGIGLVLAVSAAWFAWPAHAPTRELPHAVATVESGRPTESDAGAIANSERTVLAAPTPSPAISSRPAAAPLVVPDELTEEEIAKLETATPIGAIDGIVFVGRQPLEHGTVDCWASWDPLPARPREASPSPDRDANSSSRRHASVDRNGEFHFRALKPGPYRVGVDLGDGPRAETLIELNDAPGSRIVIVVGTALVRGHVYDDDGKAVAGAWVELSRDVTRKGSSAFITGRRTDERGAYAIDRLAAGSYWFNVRLDGSNSGFCSNATQRLPYLSIGEKRTLDFGEAKRASTWSGTVRTRGGEVVVGPAAIWIDDKKTGAHFEHAYDEQGRFSIHLRPGTYSVRVATPARPVELDAEAMTVKTSDVEQDIVIRGARLCGIVVDAETSEPWSNARPRVIVSIHREGANYPGAYLKTTVADDGRFVLDGLGAGAWMLDVYTGGYVPLLKNQRFTVIESDLDVPLRVALRAP